MPGKTHGDRLLELEKLVPALGQEIKTLRRNLGRVEQGLGGIGSRIQEAEKKQLALEPIDAVSLRERIRGLEIKIEHLEKQRSEERGRTWAITLAIVSALIGSLFTILTQLLSKYLPVK